MGQLCTHLAREDVRAKFSFDFFRKVLELFFCAVKNRVQMHPGAKVDFPNFSTFSAMKSLAQR